MNLLDIIIILVLLSLAVIGIKNGVIREAASFVGLIAIFLLSYMLKGYVGNFLCIYAPFIKYTGALQGLEIFNVFMYEMAGFLILFILFYGIYEILLKASEIMQKVANLTIILVLPSKILGALIGILKGWVLSFVALILITVVFGNQEMINNSVLADKIIYKTPVISSYASTITKSMNEIYEVTDQLSKKNLSQEESNLKCLDIMLKYKIVDKKTIEELINNQKLINTENYSSVLMKY